MTLEKIYIICQIPVIIFENFINMIVSLGVTPPDLVEGGGGGG